MQQSLLTIDLTIARSSST